MNRGKIIVIVAPSGTGKSTLIEKLQQQYPILKWSVSFTTRPKREGEVHGENYYYISKEEFIAKKEKDEFIEWAEVHSNFYGTYKPFVDEGLEKGEVLLFDVDVQGCDSFKEIYGDEAKVIFIEPPSIAHLEERLTKRATDPEHVITERLNNAEKELMRKNDFDYLVMNDDFDHAYSQLSKIFKEILES